VKQHFTATEVLVMRGEMAWMVR